MLINGPFGVGKSTTAHLLAERLPRTAVFDPEIFGYALRRVLQPVQPVADYQDLRLWRRVAVWGAWAMRRRRHLIVPMAIWRRPYFDEVTSGHRLVDGDLRCIRLTASEVTLRHRIM